MRVFGFALAALLASCTINEDGSATNAAINADASSADASNAANVGTAGNAVDPATPGPAAPGAPPGGSPAGSEPQSSTPVPPAPPPAGGVTLTAAPSRTSPGATVTLTLTNGSRQLIGYNLCTSALETAAGRPVPNDRVCTMELRTLDPGRSATYAYELPASIASGNYRFSASAERMGAGTRTVARSNSFQVR